MATYVSPTSEIHSSGDWLSTMMLPMLIYVKVQAAVDI